MCVTGKAALASSALPGILASWRGVGLPGQEGHQETGILGVSSVGSLCHSRPLRPATWLERVLVSLPLGLILSLLLIGMS